MGYLGIYSDGGRNLLMNGKRSDLAFVLRKRDGTDCNNGVPGCSGYWENALPFTPSICHNNSRMWPSIPHKLLKLGEKKAIKTRRCRGETAVSRHFGRKISEKRLCENTTDNVHCRTTESERKIYQRQGAWGSTELRACRIWKHGSNINKTRRQWDYSFNALGIHLYTLEWIFVNADPLFLDFILDLKGWGGQCI